MKRTIFFKNKPIILATSSIAGPKESMGSINKFIERKLDDDMFGEKTYEKAESKMILTVINKVIQNAKLPKEQIDTIIAGDLLNQIISSTFAVRNFSTGYLGVYNACATFTESLTLGATLIDGGYIDKVICATGSHFSTAERQYRFPLEQGTTRPAQSQWTVTGAGANLIALANKGISITSALIGKVVDYGVTDANNMGAAMAPAAADSIRDFFVVSGKSPDDYDLILTGDLGTLGSRILKDLVKKTGFNIDNNHVDCGELIYNIMEDEYQGGSGAGCSAVVFNSYVYQMMMAKKYRKILFVPTGALLSTLSTQQGESIPGIANVIELQI